MGWGEPRRATLESKIKGSAERCQAAGPRGAARKGATVDSSRERRARARPAPASHPPRPGAPFLRGAEEWGDVLPVPLRDRTSLPPSNP